MDPEEQQDDSRFEWPEFIRKVNVFFQQIERKEVLTFLLFVFVAAFFWVVQTWREENTSDFDIVFVVKDQPQNKVFTTQVPTHLRVTLADANMQLMKYSMRHNMDTLAVNFDRYADAIGNFRISAAELQSLLREDLESSTRIIRVGPSLIDSRFAQAEGRKVAVKLGSSYRVKDNYRYRGIRISPDSVLVNAPKTLLDTLKYIYTVPTKHDALTDTLVEELPLDLKIGVKATPSIVKVTVPVAEYVEKVINKIVVRVENEPEDKHLIVFPYSVSLRCLVDFNFFRNINENCFDVSVNYNDLDTISNSQHLPINVKYTGPEEVVTNIELSDKNAEYVIEKR